MEVLTAFKTFAESIQVPPVFIPAQFNFDNFAEVFESLPFDILFLNTVLMTAARTAGQVIFCSLAGYAFARLNFPGRNYIFMLFLAVMMVPGQMFLIPQYQLMQSWGLLNTIPALFLPGMFSAFGTFLMRQFFMQLPMEIEEAARLDGANTWQIYWKIMLPLAAPACWRWASSSPSGRGTTCSGRWWSIPIPRRCRSRPASPTSAVST